MNSTVKPVPALTFKRVLLPLALCWCVFWWGFAIGTSTANKAEMRYLQLTIRMADAARQEAVSNVDTHGLAPEHQRLEMLEASAESAFLFNLFAPVTAPYAWYELHRLRSAAKSTDHPR